jgi:hypothetical protein
MAYDAHENALLIACKGSPSIGKENSYEGHRAIYKFDLERKKLVTTPHFLIDLNRLDSYMDRGIFNKLSVKLAKSLGLMDRDSSFKPSGIAIHPLDGEIYIIASVGKLLIILNRDGKIKDIKELDPEIFLQPEGICFAPEGNMFISSEGKGEKGYILEFELLEKQ